jgi:O-antigen/teichoic acid export membrane protein
MQSTIHKSIVYGLTISLGLAAVVIPASGGLLSLFGEGYRSADSLLRWLCLTAPMYAVTISLISAFRVQNRLALLLWLNVLVVLLFAVPQFLFLQDYGLDFTGLSWWISQLIALVAAFLAYRYSRSGNVSDLQSIPHEKP